LENVQVVPLEHVAVVIAADVEVSAVRKFNVSSSNIDLLELNDVVVGRVVRIQTDIRVRRTATRDHKCCE
jgi:hypothetical protein